MSSRPVLLNLLRLLMSCVFWLPRDGTRCFLNIVKGNHKTGKWDNYLLLIYICGPDTNMEYFKTWPYFQSEFRSTFSDNSQIIKCAVIDCSLIFPLQRSRRALELSSTPTSVVQMQFLVEWNLGNSCCTSFSDSRPSFEIMFNILFKIMFILF